jgi:hypothetical protein
MLRNVCGVSSRGVSCYAVTDINYIGCVPTRKSNRLCRSADMFSVQTLRKRSFWPVPVPDLRSSAERPVGMLVMGAASAVSTCRIRCVSFPCVHKDDVEDELIHPELL